jgi:peroxiredoxin family protein
MKNKNLETKATRELVKSFYKILQKNKIEDDVTIIACAMNFITFILAGTEIDTKDFLEFLKKEMPERVRLYREAGKNE